MPSYNNYGIPNYQPYLQNYNQQSMPQQSNGFVWVQGEAGAKAYPVAAGTSVLLLDSESEIFYIKSTDASGMPMPLRMFEYKEKIQQLNNQLPITPKIEEKEYVTQEEFERLKRQVENITNKSINNNRKEKMNG